MEHWTGYTRFLTAVTVILDPFLAGLVFLGLTAGYEPSQRARVALIVSLTVAIMLVAAALSGEMVLSLLGTS